MNSHQTADFEISSDQTGSVAIGDATGVVAHEATDISTSLDHTGAVAIGDITVIAAHETGDTVTGSINIHGFQPQVGNRRSRCQFSEQTQIGLARNRETRNRVTVAIEGSVKDFNQRL
jgi:hypothetical protein